MSKLKEKRLIAIRQRMLSRGIEHGNNIFMSIWDLADDLNNCWYAADFISKEKQENGKFGDFSRGKFVANSWNLSAMFPAIRHAIKGSGIELRESYNNKSEYLLMKAKQ